jgi:glucose-6-phosphate dehydrogenase assembly protein OpcA
MLDAEAVWSAQDTTPSAIDAALRELLIERYARDGACAPARVLNLVAVVDKEWRGEIYNRLDGVGRYHPSRLVLCAVEEGREKIDAWVGLTSEGEAQAGEHALLRERVVLDIGTGHLKGLDSIVDPLVVPDIATLAWSPHGHPEAVDALLKLSQVVLVDSANEPDEGAAVSRARELSEDAYVVDLAWLRSTPWRERIAASFDPPQWREELGRLTSVTVRHQPASTVAALLFLGWLASRLGWEPGSLVSGKAGLQGRAHSRRQDVELKLEPDEEMTVPGLAGVAVETSSGMKLSLDRGTGGLRARRSTGDGADSEWTVLGASRGEGGILGEGIRQALLRDRAYRPALAAAGEMLT